jgi:alpha-1,3(6)-mannosylglycoprotein beta-1,6-N-acetyl-glucosaminyltransferase
MILNQAFSGGPLGELLQWSDIITSFYLLGHDLIIIKDQDELQRLVMLHAVLLYYCVYH